MKFVLHSFDQIASLQRLIAADFYSNEMDNRIYVMFLIFWCLMNVSYITCVSDCNLDCDEWMIWLLFRKKYPLTVFRWLCRGCGKCEHKKTYLKSNLMTSFKSIPLAP